MRSSEWLAAFAAIALVVVMFAIHFYGGLPPRDGFQALPVLRWPLLVTAALSLGAALAQALRKGPAVAVTLDMVGLVVSTVITVVLAVRLATTGADLAAGAFLSLAACVLIVVAMYAALRTEGGWEPSAARPVPVVKLPPDPDT